ncbi:MAG: protein-tyrosine-phosphatase [Myxococcota bacterium]
MNTARVALHPALHSYVERALPAIETLEPARRELLDSIAAFVKQQIAAGEPARLVFICTHNSRRSHIGQLWASAAAAWHGLEGVETFSGGTEATAFNPRAVAAMRDAGFEIEATTEGDNPRYRATVAEDGLALEVFSKRYDDPANPTRDFAAVMTCTEADQACPHVEGAALRIALPYVDPKISDDTPEQARIYGERVRQIGIEMLYLFSRV